MIIKKEKSCSTPSSSFLPPHFKGKKVWRRGCEEGVGIRGVQKRNQAGVPAKSPEDREVSPSVPAPRLYRRESVLPPKAPGPLAPPSTSNGKLDSLWPFKGGGGRGGRRTSPRRDRDVGGQICAFESKEGRASCVLGTQRGHESAGAGASRDPLPRAGLPSRAGRLFSNSLSSLPLWRSLNVEFK